MITESILFKVPTEYGYIIGRNGGFDIPSVEIMTVANEQVNIAGVGKKGKTINGGLWVSLKAMDTIAKQWLAARAIQKHDEQK